MVEFKYKTEWLYRSFWDNLFMNILYLKKLARVNIFSLQTSASPVVPVKIITNSLHWRDKTARFKEQTSKHSFENTFKKRKNADNQHPL